jgi:hypothetical protein
MEHREFILCRIPTEAGNESFAFVCTRDGPLAAIVRRNIPPLDVGQPTTTRPPSTGRRCGPTRRSSRVVFIVENNAHAKYTPLRERTPLDGLADCAGRTRSRA